MKWKLVKTAPKDGTVVALITKRGSLVKASWQGGLVGDNDEPAGGWTAENEGEHPPCWTDGVCWATNADNEPSDLPVLWMQLPE